MARETYKLCTFRGIISQIRILLLTLPLAGCATAYKGLGPNFFVTAPKEIIDQKRQFKLEAPAFHSGYVLGGKTYTKASVGPIVTDVSPDAATSIARGEAWQVAGAAVVIASALSWSAADADVKCKACVPSLFALGGIGLLTYGRIKIDAGVRQYNETLESRFQVTLPMQ